MAVFIKISLISLVLFVSGCLQRDGAQTISSNSNTNCFLSVPGKIESSLSLGQTGASVAIKLAQSFSVESPITVSATVDLMLQKIQKPGGFLFVSIQKNSGGTPEGLIVSSVGNASDLKLQGLPDGRPIVGGLVDVSDLEEDKNRFQTVSVSLDHGTLSVDSKKSNGRTPASTESLELDKGTYWIVVSPTYPFNATDYVLWGSTQTNQYRNGYPLSLVSNFGTPLWSISQTGIDRDMKFSLGCKN